MSKDADNYLIDFISGKEVRNTSEEKQSVQPLAKQLVEDYDYDKSQVQTHPQFRVKARPSDRVKEYPVDIAVFDSSSKKEDEIRIVAECKKNSRTDGREQLEDYLRFCKARVGVWFNGEERLFLKKVEKDGKVIFKTIPNIPKNGQRVEDIGKFKRKDLKPPHNLKNVFSVIRNYLAGNAVGTTRDETLAQQIINLVFCKIYDEKFTKSEDMVNFRVGIDEEPEKVKDRILNLFQGVKTKYKEVINVGDEIELDANSISYVVGELQNYCLIDAKRDAIADAFETFIGPSLKGAQGQFFTPRNVVELLVRLVNPKSDELLIDPASGSGGFLLEGLRHMWRNLEEKAEDFNWTERALHEEKIATAMHNIRGIEKDSFLSKVAKAYMAIVGDGKGGIFCEDSLENPSNWKDKTKQNVSLGIFDILLTNPPFGKDIKVVGENKLKQFDLGYKWRKKDGIPYKTNKLKSKRRPQTLFVERSLDLLKDGGRMGIILPETFFHAPTKKYIRNYMSKNNNIKWIIDLPHNTFRPHNNAKCIAIILEKNVEQQEKINMAVAEEVGHDHRGEKKYRWDKDKNKVNTDKLWDDIPLILEEFRNDKFEKYCFKQDSEQCKKEDIYVPRFYWQNKINEIEKKANKNNMSLVSINKLIDKDIVTHYFNGHGSPKSHYKGKGDVPYIRVKDIINWEVYRDPTAMVPDEVYEDFKDKGRKDKYLEKGDILFVRRGSYRIGDVAMVAPYDKEVILTREILTLRTTEEENKYDINPYYLIYLLEHNLTKEQFFNKILIETTLPNISDRWKQLKLPIHNDKEVRKKITSKVKNAFEKKWSARKTILDFKSNMVEF